MDLATLMHGVWIEVRVTVTFVARQRTPEHSNFLEMASTLHKIDLVDLHLRIQSEKYMSDSFLLYTAVFY